MRTNAIKLSFVAIVAIGLALLVAAIAVAQPGGADSGDQSTETPGDAPSTPSKTPDATDNPTPTAPASSAGNATPPIAAPGPAIDDSGDDDPVTESDPEAASSIEGTTPALNHGGHCVELPNDSDIVRNPDKHPNWVVGGCEPGEAETPVGEEEPGEDSGPPEGRTPSLNPDGICVALPNNSDVVRNPDKHPAWTIGGCELPAE